MIDDLVPVTNTGETVLYVGNAMVPPGETRHFARHQVPPHLLPEEPVQEPLLPPPPPPDLGGGGSGGPTLQDLAVQIAAGTVAEVSAQLAEMSDELITAVQAAEHAGQARVTLLSAIDAEVLRRAAG
jgi:hypothetical protein